MCLPFLPMLPTQILLNNLLYDLSEIGIPFDTVRAGGDGAAAGLGHAGARCASPRSWGRSPRCSTS